MTNQATKLRPGEQHTPLDIRANITRRGDNPIADPTADGGITVGQLMGLLCYGAAGWGIAALVYLAATA